MYCNGLYGMSACSCGSFILFATFVRAFCDLIIKSRENCPKSWASYNIRALLAVQGYARSALDNCKGLDYIDICSYYFARRSS